MADKSLFDRFVRRLAPYAGLFTTSTCWGSPDCDPNYDLLKINAAAEVDGIVAIDSEVDGRIDASITKQAPIVDGVWRCEARVSGHGDRAANDASIRPLTGGLYVSCAQQVGIDSRSLALSVPLRDLRGEGDGAERKVSGAVSLYTSGSATSSCEATLEATVRVTATRSEGEPAPGPAHVTAGFARDLDIELRFDGDTASTDGSRPCVTRLSGTVDLAAHIDEDAIKESPTPTCT